LHVVATHVDFQYCLGSPKISNSRKSHHDLVFVKEKVDQKANKKLTKKANKQKVKKKLTKKLNYKTYCDSITKKKMNED